MRPVSIATLLIAGAWLCATCHKGDKAFTHPLNLGDISKFQCAECHKGDYKKVPF